MTKKATSLLLVPTLALISIGWACNTAQWLQTALNDLPTLLQIAVNIAALTNGGHTPPPAELAEIQKVSGIASQGLTLLQTVYNSYQSGKGATTTQDIVEAGNIAVQNLQTALNVAQISDPQLRASVTSAVGLIVTTVDAIILLVPGQPLASPAVASAKARVAARSVQPRLLTPTELRGAWNNTVCKGVAGCPVM